MFDDLHPEPEDMFDETDKVAPQLNPPTAALPASSPQVSPENLLIEPLPESTKRFPWKMILLIVGLCVIVLSALFLSMKILSSKTPVVPEPPSGSETQTPPVVPEPVKAPPQKEVKQQEVPVPTEKTPSLVDTDKDGLTDEEEAALGTSSKTPDTDSDGLFDLEEANTWKTNPINPDTDGDGYLDGAEVKAGYNPNGAGTLREAPSESS